MNDVNKIRIKLLGVKKGDKVLDLGCSHGEQAFMFARQGLKVTGIDASKSLVAKLNRQANKEGIDCEGFIGNIEKLPFKKNSFDAIVATEVLEHIHRPETAVRECFRVLKRNGRICVSVPTQFSEKVFSLLHKNWVKNSGHINVFSTKEILSILTSAGFKVLKQERQNFEWFVFWLIHSLLKTDFDDTGSPKGYKRVSDGYFKIWNYLFRLRIGRRLMQIGNTFFPKSIYIYLTKP